MDGISNCGVGLAGEFSQKSTLEKIKKLGLMMQFITKLVMTSFILKATQYHIQYLKEIL